MREFERVAEKFRKIAGSLAWEGDKVKKDCKKYIGDEEQMSRDEVLKRLARFCPWASRDGKEYATVADKILSEFDRDGDGFISVPGTNHIHRRGS